MRYMEIGKSGLKASVMTFGAFAIGGTSWWKNSDDEESIKTLHRAFELGINTVDTAPVYGFGHSEEVLGKALKGHRDQVLVSTKCGLWWETDEGSYRYSLDGRDVRRNLSAKTIRIELENSLRRLDTDYIDIYYTHNPCCPPVMTPYEETVGLLMEFKKEGKIRAIGASNMTPQEIIEYRKYGEIDIIQGRYSMISRASEKEIIPMCKELGMSFHGYMPMESGLLTGKITRDYVVPEGDVRNSNPWYKKEKFDKVMDLVDALKPFAEKYNCKLSQLVIAYVLGQEDFINPLCGARRVSQIEETALAADIIISPEDLAAMRALADKVQ